MAIRKIGCRLFRGRFLQHPLFFLQTIPGRIPLQPLVYSRLSILALIHLDIRNEWSESPNRSSRLNIAALIQLEIRNEWSDFYEMPPPCSKCEILKIYFLPFLLFHHVTKTVFPSIMYTSMATAFIFLAKESMCSRPARRQPPGTKPACWVPMSRPLIEHPP